MHMSVCGGVGTVGCAHHTREPHTVWETLGFTRKTASSTSHFFFLFSVLICPHSDFWPGLISFPPLFLGSGRLAWMMARLLACEIFCQAQSILREGVPFHHRFVPSQPHQGYEAIWSPRQPESSVLDILTQKRQFPRKERAIFTRGSCHMLRKQVDALSRDAARGWVTSLGWKGRIKREMPAM